MKIIKGLNSNGFQENKKMTDLKKVPYLELEIVNPNSLDEISIQFKDGRAVAYRSCANGKVTNPIFIDTNAPKEKIIILRLSE